MSVENTLVPSACNAAKLGDIAKVVLMPGDPLRAKYIAETYLESPVCFNGIRNMLGYTGDYKGKRISVMGSGMGIPSMGLYAYELYEYYDVDCIIRVGSAGALSEKVKVREVIVAMSASTDSNFDSQYNYPGKLSPVADYEILKTAMDVAQKRKVRAHAGAIFTSDVFYSADKDFHTRVKANGHLAIDMETAGLYLTAMHADKKALSILTISDDVFSGEALTSIERQESFGEMMEIALETAWLSI